jgi:hypothetical protein
MGELGISLEYLHECLSCYEGNLFVGTLGGGVNDETVLSNLGYFC